MTDTERQNLYARNNKIIEIIMREIQEKCPDAIAFDNSLNEWKKLYDMFGLKIQFYHNLEKFENLNKGNDRDENKKI